jgi:hypothetical protein
MPKLSEVLTTTVRLNNLRNSGLDLKRRMEQTGDKKFGQATLETIDGEMSKILTLFDKWGIEIDTTDYEKVIEEANSEE